MPTGAIGWLNVMVRNGATPTAPSGWARTTSRVAGTAAGASACSVAGNGTSVRSPTGLVIDSAGQANGAVAASSPVNGSNLPRTAATAASSSGAPATIAATGVTARRCRTLGQRDPGEAERGRPRVVGCVGGGRRCRRRGRAGRRGGGSLVVVVARAPGDQGDGHQERTHHPRSASRPCRHRQTLPTRPDRAIGSTSAGARRVPTDSRRCSQGRAQRSAEDVPGPRSLGPGNCPYPATVRPRAMPREPCRGGRVRVSRGSEPCGCATAGRSCRDDRRSAPFRPVGPV